MYLIFIIILTFLFLSLAWSGLSFAPWIPTRRKDLARIAKLADLKPSETFYDLGCGTGRVPFYLSKNSQAKVFGLEISWPFFLICKIKQIFQGHPNLKFKFKNLYTEDLSQADVVYAFGTPKTINTKLIPKLKNELKPGSRFISYAFPVENWQPQVIDKPNPGDVAIFVYIIP